MTASSSVLPTRLGFLPALAFLWLASVPGAAEQWVERHGRLLTPEEAAALPAPPASRAEPSWGTLDTSTYTLGACDATSRVPSTDPDFGNCTMVRSQFSIGFALLGFPVHLPNGALIEAVTMNYYDTHETSEPTAGLYRNGPTGGSELLFPMNPAPTAGGNASTTFIPAVPVQIDNEVTAYVILLLLDAVQPSEYEGLYNFSVRYRLQVSPAPAFATFGDVPLGHPFHRFVEALAAAGITAGCGGGDFCVDTPLTRGQMAVFLSLALGLHFPN